MKQFALIFVISSWCNALFSQGQITNFGNLNLMNGSQISIYGDLVNNGNLVDSSQVVTLKGSTIQSVGGNSVTIFKNLTLDNSSGAKLTADIKLKNTLTISLGTFTSTGYNLTLISDANGTARIAPIIGDFDGNITMERYLPSGPTDWRFLASPINNITLNDWYDDFIMSGFPGSHYPTFAFTSIYTYDESVGGINDYGYNPATSISDPIIPKNGYWCYIGPTPITIDVTGPPVKFNQTFSVTYNASAGSSHDGWNMIGNPYPSDIDWTSPSWTKTNINNAVYIWNSQNQQYASWVAGVGTNGGTSIIPSSQSFWVQTNASSPQLTCTENIKVAGNQTFLRESQISEELIKLKMSGNGYKDEAVIRFSNNATHSFDSDFDARKMASNNTQVQSLSTLDSSLNNLTINSIPTSTTDVNIPVKALVGVSGTYTISWDSIGDNFIGSCVVLEDLSNGIKTNLKNNTSYVFTIQDTTQAPRFLIHVSASILANAFPVSCANSANGKCIAKGTGTGPWDYAWYNSNNTNIHSTFNSFASDSLMNLSPGAYSVTIYDSNSLCGSNSRAFNIVEPPPVISNFILSKYKIFAAVDSVQAFNYSLGASSYTWNFGDNSSPITQVDPPAHYYYSDGNYTITLIAKFANCVDSFKKEITVISPSAIKDNKSNLNSFYPFPNPSDGNFNFILIKNAELDSKLDIYDLVGRKIYSTLIKENKTQIDISDQPSGTYIYHITLSTNEVINGRLVIQK